ncbi:hypothetical protein QUA62_08530 [Microcoleus sp. MON1_C1]|uniref:hypothetical protein n=1 Tax=unclassified Microcoleus TaxID=2642155 RepID=UPI002FD303EA
MQFHFLQLPDSARKSPHQPFIFEFSTVAESEKGSSATDSLSEDVTDGWKKEEGRRKKE